MFFQHRYMLLGCFPDSKDTGRFQVASGVVFSLAECLAVPAGCFSPLCTLPWGCERAEEHHWKFLEHQCNPQGTCANAWSRNTIPRAHHKFLEQKCSTQGTAACSQGSNANTLHTTPELQWETVVLQGSPHLALVVLGTRLVVSDASPYLQEWSPMTGSSPSHRGCGPASSAPGPCAATPRTWSRCCGSWLALESTSRLLLVLHAAELVPAASPGELAFYVLRLLFPAAAELVFHPYCHWVAALAPEQHLVCMHQQGARCRQGRSCRVTVLHMTTCSITAFISTLALAMQSCGPDLSLRQDLSLQGAP